MDKLSFLDNANGAFVDELWDQYQTDPQSLHPSWQRFFEGIEFADGRAASDVASKRENEATVMKLINAYRARGHLVADLYPLDTRRVQKADLDLDYFGLSENDLDSEFEVGNEIRIGNATLREIISHLRITYCGSIGVEYRYIPDSRIRRWLHEKMESCCNRPNFNREKKLQILQKLAEAVGFEKFLHVKYVGQKRFSLEGAESFIPALDALFHKGAELGAKEFVMGMAHRGRLNVLVNLFHKSYETMFSEFEGGVLPDDVHGDGDVKYHRGYSDDIVTADGHRLHLSLQFNPSHLEAVGPVVHGVVRAKGENLYDSDFKKIVPIVVHGDAALSGQGVVYELLNFHNLKGYRTGGTIHVVINNQVGFTATEQECRSSRYCTDIAKSIECPVFHVNADDPEAVVYVAEMAIRLRQEFGIDVFIDLVCYRRYGHNEGDDPRFTQPLLYKMVEKHPSVLDIYMQRIARDRDVSTAEAEQITSDFRKLLQESHSLAQERKPKIEVDFLGAQWSGLRSATADDFEASPETGVPPRRLASVADALVNIPEGLTPYSKLTRILDHRRKLYFEDKAVDWGLAELLAYGSLLCDNIQIRMAGQDTRRGTFAHRHAVYLDVNDETEYIPLNNIQTRQQQLAIYNSTLSEYGVLGFEYGYSLATPKGLTIWEAQFGDFANGAQIIIDQFISSAESKWQRMSGIVLLLPHGDEGQGPEHSSARLNRFLELCGDHNMMVCNATTPANFFHLIRRHATSEYRVPLVVMTPKSLLRHPLVRSPVSELETGKFNEIIDDPYSKPATTKRVLMCSGKIYYDLLKKKEEAGRDDVAIVRIEQLYPLPRIQVNKLKKRYHNITDWIWVQEEAVNMGAWLYIQRQMSMIKKFQVISRPESASPASGSLEQHKVAQKKLVERAFQ